jgi:hypothetical protein
MNVKYNYKLSMISNKVKVDIKDSKNVLIYGMEMGNFDTNQTLFDLLPIDTNYVISGNCKLVGAGGSIDFGIMFLDGRGSGISVKSRTQGYNFAILYS